MHEKIQQSLTPDQQAILEKLGIQIDNIKDVELHTNIIYRVLATGATEEPGTTEKQRGGKPLTKRELKALESLVPNLFLVELYAIKRNFSYTAILERLSNI